MKRLITAILCLAFAFPAMAEIIDGYDPNEKVRPYRLDVDGRMIGWNLVIDSCEAITDWTALSNDTTGIAVDLDHVMGAKSLEFDKVDGTDNLVFGGIQKTLTAVDLTTIVENGGSFTVSMNVSALTDIAYCFLRLGTSASHYNEWRVDDNDMAAGWNSLRFNADTPTSAGSTGNGWNPAIVTYLAIGCAFDLETDALADLRVDHITARGGQQVSADINASSSSSSGPMAQVDVQQYGGNPVTTADADTGAGVDNLQRSINVVPASGGAVIGTEDYDTGAGLDHVNRVGLKVPGAGGAVTITGAGGSLDIDINAQTKTTVRVSDDDAANTIANPMYFQISQDGSNAMAAAYPLPVSRDMAQNLVTNPIWFQISQNGTNAMAAANPLAISATMAQNLVTNPIWMQLSQDGTNAVDGTHPLPISKDLAVNSDTNRVFVQSDTTKLGGVAITLNTGVVGTGVQRVVNASDDPNLAKLTAWDDGADRANVNVEHDWEIDSMDVTTGWAVANDASANLATNANHVEGVGSLEFDKVDGTNFTEGYIEKTITSMDLNDYEAHNSIEWSIYMTSLTDVEYAFLRLGTDLNNYSEWRVDDEDLTAGQWNPIAMFAGNVQHAVVGTGLITTAVTYVAVGVSFSNESDALAGIVIDHIQIHESAHTTASIAAEVKTSVTTANINLAKVKNQITNVNGGVRDAGTQTTTLADDDPAVLSLAALDNAVIVDDAAFTPASDSVSMAGFEHDDIATNPVEEGDGGAARMSANRNVYVTMRDAAGNERGQDITAEGRAEVQVENHWEIDSMDATTGWVVANDATVNLATLTNHVEGSNSLEFDKVDGTGFTEAYIEKTISSTDLDLFAVHNLVEWAVYLSSLTDVEYAFVRLGTDNANYSEWRVLVGDLTAGTWNAIAMFAGDVEFTVTGTGIDSSAVTYAAIGVSFSAESDALADMAFDAIHIHETSHSTATIAAAVTSSVTTANINVQKVGNKIVPTGSGNLGVNGVQRIAIATDDVNQSAINASVAIMDDWDGTEDGAAATDGATVMFEARTAQKAAVDNGDAVRPTTNDHGETVVAGHTWATNSNRVEEIDPLDQKEIPGKTSVTNGTDGTYKYYYDMDGYTPSGYQIILDCDAGTVTATVSCTLVDDGTAAAAITDWEVVTNGVFGVANLQSAAAPASDIWIDNAAKLAQCKYVMVQIVANATGGNTGDWTIHAKKSAM